MNLIIYIPGLGGQDTLDRQQKVVGKWNNDNTATLFLQPRWRDKTESFKAKLSRLTADIQKANLKEYSGVIFFGTSAGGTLGLNLFNEFCELDSTRFVSICGYSSIHILSNCRSYGNYELFFVSIYLFLKKVIPKAIEGI